MIQILNSIKIAVAMKLLGINHQEVISKMIGLNSMLNRAYNDSQTKDVDEINNHIDFWRRFIPIKN